ncbi:MULTISPECIES: PLDc N-terminal domain-containing protein [Cyanophyceae]|uniref:PLDc N-terminal domain-containing protein n=1 Tax=Cyanophyceae TaxID=3028117 RepID=UPI00168A141B|nr:PLD nuclease N-terminal domain-containing protein [Trichocoleus sp. FACHB-69]MBD1930392.1 PLDc_N domain-containing protein [Trichocoleus sp. FACHB-69]
MSRWQISAFSYGILGILIFVFLSFILSKKLELNAILPVLFAILFVGVLFFWLWILIDCITKEPNDRSNKLAWLIVILFTNGIGALIYYFVRRPQRIKELGR